MGEETAIWLGRGMPGTVGPMAMRSLLLALVIFHFAGLAARAEDAVNKPLFLDSLRSVSEVEIYDRLAWGKATDLLDALGRSKSEAGEPLYLADRMMAWLDGEACIVGIFQHHGSSMGGLPLVIVLFDDTYRPIVWGKFEAIGFVAWAGVLQSSAFVVSEAELVVLTPPVRAVKPELFFQKYAISRSGIKLLGQGGQWPLADEKK